MPSQCPFQENKKQISDFVVQFSWFLYFVPNIRLRDCLFKQIFVHNWAQSPPNLIFWHLFKVFFWSLIIIWSNPVSEKFQISLQVRISPQWWLKLGRGSAKWFILHVRPSLKFDFRKLSTSVIGTFPNKTFFLEPG